MKMTQRLILLLLLFASIAIVILNDFVLSGTPEFFKYGDELGQVLSNLSLAYISSYIFYTVVVVMKERSDNKNIHSTVYKLTKNLVSRAYSVYNEIGMAAGDLSHDKRKITKDDFIELCGKVNPRDGRPDLKILGGIPGKWGESIYYNSVTYVQRYADRIFNYMPFLDSEYVRLVNKLLDSSFFSTARLLNENFANTDFSPWASNMYDYLICVRELEQYNESVNKKYID